jgi:hypothetical protein
MPWQLARDSDHCMYVSRSRWPRGRIPVPQREDLQLSFTAHNIKLPDGSETMPEIGYLVSDSPWMKAAARVLRVVFRDTLADKSIADLGCLEGGYTVEFSRMGMQATGIEVRQSNT